MRRTHMSPHVFITFGDNIVRMGQLSEDGSASKEADKAKEKVRSSDGFAFLPLPATMASICLRMFLT